MSDIFKALSVFIGGAVIIISTVIIMVVVKEPVTVVIYENGDVICEIYD